MIGRCLAASLLFAGGHALAAERAVTPHAITTLLPEKDAFEPGETLWFALAQQLEPGWHVYWRNPGDSGLPLDLDWALPEGYSAGEIVYPLPEQIEIPPLANFGHRGEPVFLIPIAAPSSAEIGKVVQVGLKATWLICEEICVPEEAALSLRIPVSAAADPSGGATRIFAEARRDAATEDAGPSTYSSVDGAVIVDMPAPKSGFGSAYFFPEKEGLIEPAAEQKAVVADGRLHLSMKPGFAFDSAKREPLAGVVVFESDGARTGAAINASPTENGSVAPLAKSAPSSPPQRGLPILLLSAFFGGLLLNAMPCVFPVLFIKAASLAKSREAAPAIARRDGLLYALGVVVSFAALGGLLLSLRAGGAAIGWGFHLQSPPVVLLSAYVLFLAGLNLAGVFHVGESVQGAGAGLASRGGAAGAFFTGVLAVVVAAPCIGPLLTAPIGAAVLLPPASGMLIFLALALGLALPFAAISFSPGLARLLPRPGPWMDVFRQALAFPVFAGAAFFLWVLAQQTGSGGLARALGGALLLALAAWLFERSKSGGRAWIVRAAAAAATIAAVAPIADLKLVESANAAQKTYGRLAAAPYNSESLLDFREGGRPVFVDFTAAWCVTCQVNKLTILSSSRVAEAFSESNAVLMTADWTRRDPIVTEALESFGASGVPLYVYYPVSGSPKVLALPLTERSVIDALVK